VNGVNPEPLDPGLATGARQVDPRLETLASYRGEIVEATAREVASSGAGTPAGRSTGPQGRSAPRPRSHVGAADAGEAVLGDDGDLAAVYRRLYPSLVRTAYLLVDTREQAEEVVQEAFAKAFPRWDRLRVPEAYVRTCVVNGCRRVQRRRGLARRLVVPPLDEVRGEHDHIADAVRRLPSPQREAVVLRYYLQATDAEIAATLKVALGTVKSSLHRARAALREQFLSNAEEEIR
jgi:RNA polymerase sigma-70 factor (sigma-E family)